MHKKSLSFAIVTYNNSKIIAKTIKSIIENIPEEYTYTFYIIDNNSSDNTIDVVKRIRGNIEVIELYENNGFGYGHNIALKYIDSKYHFVVNPDISIESKDQIKKIVEYMDDNSEVGMISPLILNDDRSIQHLCKKNPTVFDMLIRRISPNIFKSRQNDYMLLNTGYNKIMQIEYASGCFMVFKSDLFKEINGFDDNFFMYLEDADITRRVNEVSKAIFYPHAQVIHSWERGGHKSIKLAWITVQSMIVYFKKWGLKLY